MKVNSKVKFLLIFLFGGVIALGLITAVRFFNLEPATHLHANWAIYIDGNKVDFSKDEYQEETSTCGVSEDVKPNERVHLHENNPDVIHVHHKGVTWGHLLSNLGFSLNQDTLVDDKGNSYKDSKEEKLRFILNGKIIFSPYNTVIGNEDRLLISYGESEDMALKTLYPEVKDNAHEYNERYDPASCSGDEETLLDKLKRSFLF